MRPVLIFPINAAYGLSGIQVAMTREMVKLDLSYDLFKVVPAVMPEECISLREALEATPTKQSQDIRVLETVFKGETVFSAAAPDNNI